MTTKEQFTKAIAKKNQATRIRKALNWTREVSVKVTLPLTSDVDCW